MKLLLVAVNAKYIHSNLAVYSLRAFANKYAENIKILEMTINHSEEEILKAIYKEKADVVAFSCYIWNIDMMKQIAAELKKVLPEVRIWFGGPEVSYDARLCLKDNPVLDGIMIGEGEQTFLELTKYYVEGTLRLEDIPGLAFWEKGQLIITSDRQLISLDTIPFPYEKMEDFKNKIIYYESSRGCPFSCSYCLSSIDKSVRLRNTQLVKQELKVLLDQQVPQVKFVDRTFNCNKKHAMEIWQFIKENDNGVTNFHFEISADLLTEEEMELLAGLRPGQVQFEIGVQSTNTNTISVIHRRMDFDIVSRNVLRIKAGNNIHQHLDLIAGLPLEDYNSFKRSFDDVYRLKPDQLQLGFLKILKGSRMEAESSSYGIVYRNKAPYEVLSTDRISFDELLKIKGICDMVEIYYNSAQFTWSIRFLEHLFDSPIKLYEELSEYYERNYLSGIAHNRIKRYDMLLDFFKEIILGRDLAEDGRIMLKLFTELLVLDLYLREDLKTRPQFSPQHPLQSSLHEIYKRYGIERKSAHIEQFSYDVFTSARLGKPIKKDTILIFDYKNRNPLNKAAKIMIVC